MGQTFARMGAKDPRLNAFGEIDFRIKRQLREYARTDDPPARVKPIALPVLHFAYASASASGLYEDIAIADVIYLAFFFLLRPGEFTTGPTNSHPFRLKDVQLWLGGQRVDILQVHPEELQGATFATLTFSNQKNGVRGEVIGHGLSGSHT
ncbi:MAG: hypothetical protein ACRD41_16445, partial [Candidatus Acidiferrales bacterium]